MSNSFSSFGPGPYDTLVVCHNTQHIYYVQQAFKYAAVYTTFTAAKTGRRYNRVIVFRPYELSDNSRTIDQIQYWQTCVPPNGEFYLI